MTQAIVLPDAVLDGVDPSVRILEPGDYFVELEVSPDDTLIECSKLTAEALEAGLHAIGWDEVELDHSRSHRSTDPVWRFVGRVEHRTLALRDTPLLRWIETRPLTIDPFADLPIYLHVYPFDLIKGETSEIRMLSWLPTHQTREEVIVGLNTMGFSVQNLSALRKNMHLPDRPGASVTLWVLIGARWEKAKTIVTIGEPFLFESMVPTDTPPEDALLLKPEEVIP